VVESGILELSQSRILQNRAAVKRPRDVSWILFICAIVPAALIAGLIARYGVNVPFGDEWSLISLFARWHDHQMTFADLFRQHNEHRIFFPKLIYIAFAQLTHWNLRAEMFFSVFLCAGTSVCIYGLLKRTVAGSRLRRTAIWALSNLLLFSPSQAENWMWGFQLQMFIPTLCLIASLLILHAPNVGAWRLASACGLAIIGTYSFGNGLLLWPIIGAYLFLRGTGKRRLLFWAGAFVVVGVTYFFGYEPHPSPGRYHASTLDYLVYFLRFNGNALGQLPLQSHLLWTAVIGAGAVLLFGIAAALFLKARSSALSLALPWLALASYALASAFIATYSRVREGIEQALDSRYSSISVHLYIGLVGLLIIGSDCLGKSRINRRVTKVTASFACAFVAMLVSWYLLTLSEIAVRMRDMSQLRTHGSVNLTFCKVIRPTKILPRSLSIHMEFPEFVRSIADLDRLQLLSPPLRRTNLLYESFGAAAGLAEEFGLCETASRTGETALEIRGWAFLPFLAEPAPCVVLAYESGGQWIGFALAEVNAERPDLAGGFGEAHRWSGWRRVIDTSALPNNARISAWAVDPRTTDVFRLPGVIVLPE
jgi:hypothetical protein